MRDPQDLGHIPHPALGALLNRGDATKHTAALTKENLAHLRACTACRIAWYRAGAWRAGCTDQRLGAAVLVGTGATEHLSAEVRAHIDACIACQLTHRALTGQTTRAVPSPALLRRFR